MSVSSSDAGARALARVARAILAGWAILAIELAVALTSARREITSVWELEYGLLWLAPSALVASAAVTAVGAFLTWLLTQSEQRRVRGLVAAVGALSGAVVGFGVGGGRHLATPAARGGFAALVAAAGGLTLWWAAPALARLLRTHAARCLALVAWVVLAAELVNRFVLVRLYPAFHLALASGVLLCVPLAGEAIDRWLIDVPRALRLRVSAGTLAVVALCGAFVLPSAGRLARFDNFRFVVSERAPLASRAVALAALVAPVSSDDGSDCAALSADERARHVGCAGQPEQASGRTLDLRNRDFLLISIDALRADHLGAYGYARATTPHIDALAKDSVVFEHAYAPTPHTSYSVTSLMTGKYMRPLLLQGVARDSDTWAGLFRTYGYRTAAFYPPAVFF
ncbi:MAG TPA: sulfatase-like hydrolase/transferase, partial [Polyangiaceae bacterium]